MIQNNVTSRAAFAKEQQKRCLICTHVPSRQRCSPPLGSSEPTNQQSSPLLPVRFYFSQETAKLKIQRG